MENARSQEVVQAPKTSYKKPELKTYGTVQKLTADHGFGFNFGKGPGNCVGSQLHFGK